MTRWQDERHVAMLRELWPSGDSAGQIARAMNAAFPGADYTRNSVNGKAHRLGMATDQRRAAAAPGSASSLRTRNPLGVKSQLAARDLRGLYPIQPVTGAATRAILELGPMACRWPIGDPSSPLFRFCCARQKTGSYCEEHAGLAYTPLPPGRAKTGNELARSLRGYV